MPNPLPRFVAEALQRRRAAESAAAAADAARRGATPGGRVPPVTPDQAALAAGLTQEAIDLVKKMRSEAAVPSQLTNNLLRIAEQNALEIVGKPTPQSIINALDAKYQAAVDAAPKSEAAPRARPQPPGEKAAPSAATLDADVSARVDEVLDSVVEGLTAKYGLDPGELDAILSSPSPDEAIYEEVLRAVTDDLRKANVRLTGAQLGPVVDEARDRVLQYMRENTATLPPGQGEASLGRAEPSVRQPVREEFAGSPSKEAAIKQYLAEKAAREQGDAAQVLFDPESEGGRRNNIPRDTDAAAVEPQVASAEASGSLADNPADPLDPELVDSRASGVNSRFPQRGDGPRPGTAGGTQQVLYPADNRPRDPDTDNLIGPRKNDPTQIRTTQDPGPTDQYRIVAEGSANNLAVYSEADATKIPGSIMDFGEGRFVFSEAETGRLFLFDDVTTGPKEISERDFLVLSRNSRSRPVGQQEPGAFPRVTEDPAESLQSMISDLRTFAEPGSYPSSLNIQSLQRTLEEIDILRSVDPESLQRMLDEVFTTTDVDGALIPDREAASQALYNAGQLRDALLKDPSMLQMVDGKAVNTSADGSVPPIEASGRVGEGSGAAFVGGRPYVLDEAGLDDLNDLRRSVLEEQEGLSILRQDLEGMAGLRRGDGRFAVELSDPSLYNRMATRSDFLDEVVYDFKEAISMGDPDRIRGVLARVDGRLKDLRKIDAEINLAFMGPGDEGEALADFAGGPRVAGQRFAVNRDGSVELLDGKSSQDGRPVVEVFSNPNEPDDFMLSRQAKELAQASTMPQGISQLRTLIRDAFRSRNVSTPLALADSLEARPRGSRVPSEQALQEIGAEIERIEDRLRNPLPEDNDKIIRGLRKELKAAQRRAGKIADGFGGDASSASVAAESAFRREKGWTGTADEFLSQQLGIDSTATGGARAEAFSRINPASPVPADATPAEIAAREAIAQAYGTDGFPLETALESIVVGRNNPEILNARERLAGSADQTRGRLANLPTPPTGLLSRLVEGIRGTFAPGGASATERVQRIRDRLQARLTRQEGALGQANAMRVSPSKISSAIDEMRPRTTALPSRSPLQAVPEESPAIPSEGPSDFTPAEGATEADIMLGEEAAAQRFSGDEDAQPVDIKTSKKTPNAPREVLEVGESVERLREAAEGSQEFADLEYLWSRTLGGGDPKKAFATGDKSVREAVEEANSLIEKLDAQFAEGGSGMYGNDMSSSSLRLADAESYADAEPVELDNLHFLSRADAELAAAAIRGEMPTFIPEEAQAAAERLGLVPDLRPGREVKAEVFEKADGSVAVRVGAPFKETRGSTAPRTMFFEIDVTQPGTLQVRKGSKARLYRLDPSTGEIKNLVRDSDKVARIRQARAIKGTMFDPDYIDPTSFSGRSPTAQADELTYEGTPFNYEDAPANRMPDSPAQPAARAEAEPATADVAAEVGTARRAADADEIAAEMERIRAREEAAEEKRLAGDPDAYDPEIDDPNDPDVAQSPYWRSRLRETPDAIEAKQQRVRDARTGKPDPSAPKRSPAARRILSLLPASVVVAGGAAYRPEDEGINEVGPATARERIAERLRELRGVPSRRRIPAYGTTQLYTPNFN